MRVSARKSSVRDGCFKNGEREEVNRADIVLEQLNLAEESNVTVGISGLTREFEHFSEEAKEVVQLQIQRLKAQADFVQKRETHFIRHLLRTFKYRREQFTKHLLVLRDLHEEWTAVPQEAHQVPHRELLQRRCA